METTLRETGQDLSELDSATLAAAERLRSGRWGYRFAKRAFDILFSLAVFVCFSWLFLLVAIAIKLDDPEGPVVFAQTRVGRDGHEFRMYKFRSMCADAEERLVALSSLNEKDGPVFKIADDPRITRVGRVIRKLSIDELPQFVNVLKGDLSVVGPRPAFPLWGLVLLCLLRWRATRHARSSGFQLNRASLATGRRAGTETPSPSTSGSTWTCFTSGNAGYGPI